MMKNPSFRSLAGATGAGVAALALVWAAGARPEAQAGGPPVVATDITAAEVRAVIAHPTGGADRLIKAFPKVDVRLNEPYGPKDGVLHTLNLHAAPRGLKSAMIEIRNDFIANERGQNEWAQRLAMPLIHATTK